MKNLLVGLCFALPVFAQDPGNDVALALLRGDAEAAARAAASATDPALRARLQAALLPTSERAAAMLTVAQSFPRSEEADRALVAGVAAVLLATKREALVPELLHQRAETNYGLTPVLLGLRAAAAARRTVGGDAALLDEAERLLSLACVTRFGLRPAQVRPDAVWQRPVALAEPLALRLLPSPAGTLSWGQVDALGAPSWSATLPATGPFELPALPRGDWLLDVRSQSSPWRGVQRVLVSDVDVVALLQDGCLALAAFAPGGPVAGQWEIAAAGAVLQRGALGAGASLVELDAALRVCERSGELHLQGDAGRAWTELPASFASLQPKHARFVVHGMVDRPVYRPGETVLGRIVLRHCAWDRTDFAAVPTTSPAAAIEAQLVVTGRHDSEALRLPLRTDANGLASFSFVIPPEFEPGSSLDFQLAGLERAPAGETNQLWVGRLGAIAAYRRAAVQLAAVGPARVLADAAQVEVVLQAKLASGGPAAGIGIVAAVTASDDAGDQVVDLCTGSDGCATVRVPIAGLVSQSIEVDAEAKGPQGECVRAFHRVEIERQGAEPPPSRWLRYDSPEIEIGDAVVGEAARITLRGRPRAQVLLVVGRGRNARARTLQLGADGTSTLAEPVLRCDWPRFDVTAATSADEQHAQVGMRLRRVEVAIDVPDHATPGADTLVRVHCAVPQALVTIAIVDERIFENDDDAVDDLDAALRPDLSWQYWERGRGPNATTPGEILARVLHHGRVPNLAELEEMGAGQGSGGGAGGRAAASRGLRSRFQPTAHFVTVVADANGDAATTFRLPDDLTRWRATAAVVTPDGAGALAQRTFASRQPLALEPVLPRVLRAGDAFALPLAIDRSAEAVADTEQATVTAAATGEALVIARATTTATVPAGRAATITVPVRAVAAGEATLQLAVQLGAHADRSERPIAVVPDRVTRPLVAAATGTPPVTVPPPIGSAPEAGVVVDVLQGGSEAWRLLEAELARYPYGCVEQTLSQLLPFFGLARAAKERGEQPPAMDEAFARRLRTGLARLRELRDYRDAFSFWPGGEPDPAMSGLVLHGLAQLQEAGLDLQVVGLRDRSAWSLEDPVTEGADVVVDAAFLARAEHLAGALRLYPDSLRLRRQLQAVVDALPRLPAGLCVRLGLALHAAGDADGTRACRQRLQEVRVPELAPDAFPGEEPIAVQALRLELDLALGIAAAERDRAAADLLLACLRGGGSTYGRGCALAVLARALPRAQAREGTVVVECGGERREIVFAAGVTAKQCRFARGADVVVRGPESMPLLVRVTAERAEPASSHAAWATPIRVERRWGRHVADDKELEPWVGPLQVGRAVTLELVVHAPVAMRRVVVDCPLPAGCEVRGAGFAQRFDDRLAFACDLDATHPFVQRLVVVPTLAGRFVWPPATATPMYAGGFDGGTAGTFVDCVVPPGNATPSLVTCHLQPPAKPEPQAPDPFGDACTAVGEACDDEREPDLTEAARQQRVDSALVVLERADPDVWRSLTALQRLVRSLDHVYEPEAPERLWRRSVQARVQRLLVERTQCALREAGAEAPRDFQERVDLLHAALADWPPDARREPWIVRWWQLANGSHVDGRDLMSLCEGVPRHSQLRAALRDLVRTEDPYIARQAFDRLPAEERTALPPALVLERLPLDDELLAWVLASSSAHAELRVRLQDPGYVRRNAEVLQAGLPATEWAAVPLPAFAALALGADDRDGVDAGALVARLVAAAVPSAALQAELATSKQPAWRFVLASALRARGADAGAVAASEATAVAWQRALALRPDDVVAAIALYGARRDAQVGIDLGGEVEQFGCFLASLLVARATPEQLYAGRALLDDKAWRAAWTRLDEAERIALIGRFQKNLHANFVPATAAEAAALWQFMLRTNDVDGPVDALLGSRVGVECVRGHLLARDGGVIDQEVRSAFAKAFAVEPATLQPPPGGELRALLLRMQRLGGANLSQQDQASWQQARRARGA